MATYTFNLITQGAEADLCEFKASTVYRVRSSLGRALDIEALSQKIKQAKKARQEKALEGNPQIQIPLQPLLRTTTDSDLTLSLLRGFRLPLRNGYRPCGPSPR